MVKQTLNNVSLLRISLSQFEEPIAHRIGPRAGPAEAGDHGGEIVSLVEAVFELGKVARDMPAVDGAAGASGRNLDVAERGIDPLEGRCALLRYRFRS